jgi:hypothetical protein
MRRFHTHQSRGRIGLNHGAGATGPRIRPPITSVQNVHVRRPAACAAGSRTSPGCPGVRSREDPRSVAAVAFPLQYARLMSRGWRPTGHPAPRAPGPGGWRPRSRAYGLAGEIPTHCGARWATTGGHPKLMHPRLLKHAHARRNSQACALRTGRLTRRGARCPLWRRWPR